MKTLCSLALFIGGCAARQPETRSATAMERAAPPSAVSLLTSVNELEVPGPSTDHARVLAAFEALGEALQFATPTSTNEILRVKASCQALKRSVTNAHARADFVRIGLVAATDALAAAAPSDRNVRAMAEATAQIDPDKNLADQYFQVRAALRASVRVVYAVDGASEPTIAPARSVVTAAR